MQRNIKNKITFFAFGLLAGVTIGVVFGVAIKSLLGHLNELKSGIVKIGSKEDRISKRLDSIEGKMEDNKNKIVIVKVNKTTAKTAIRPPPNNSNKAIAVKDSVKRTVDNRDSIPINDDIDDSGDVVVMTNQIINTTNISLVNLDTAKTRKNKAAEQADSAIDALNDTKPLIAPSSYRIEYWESPLNFKGYKMSWGKIILYGINTNIPLKLVKLEDTYYLLAGKDIYNIGYTDDLKPFDKVTNKATLKKLGL